MSASLYDHDLGGNFVGHFFGHDVYLVQTGDGELQGSILARYGNQPCEYASQALVILQGLLANPTAKIGTPDGTLSFREWIFSGKGNPATKAMVLALAMEGMRLV